MSTPPATLHCTHGQAGRNERNTPGLSGPGGWLPYRGPLPAAFFYQETGGIRARVRRLAGGLIICLILTFCPSILRSHVTALAMSGNDPYGRTGDLAIREERSFSVVDSNIVYCSSGGTNQLLDLYQPSTPISTPDPVVLYLHGGGFYEGNNSYPPPPMEDDITHLEAAGYIVALVNYRLAPQYLWPAQIEDVKCAVRFLRQYAKHYNIDPNRIGAFGDSAGGQLAALLGLDTTHAGWDVGQYLGQSSKVEGVGDMFGPTDYSITSDFGAATYQKVLTTSFGSNQALMDASSPINYITAGAAPFLIQHGYEDGVVSYKQSQLLHDRLIGVNDVAQLQFVQNAGHEFVPVPTGAIINPSLTQLADQVVSFFNQTFASCCRP